MANVSAMSTVGDISGALAIDGSFNLYMGFGGSNWGYYGGANGGGTDYQPVITSYDYDAPVSEGGGHGYGHDGDKYDAIRRIISYWSPKDPPPPAEPAAPLTTSYAPIQMNSMSPLFPNLPLLSPPPFAGLTLPLPSMESLNASAGYILFNVTLPSFAGDTVALKIATVSDYATVFVDGVYCGSLWRPKAATSNVSLPAAPLNAGGATLSILVENMGHINYGRGWYDPKGIFGAISINGIPLGDTLQWTASLLPLHPSQVAALPFSLVSGPPSPATPAFFKGTLTTQSPPTDTYITLCGWGKGQIYVNNFHLARHWASSGPQHTYYVPSGLLQEGDNLITVFENIAPPSNLSLAFSQAPDFTGSVCGLSVVAAPPPSGTAPSKKNVGRDRRLGGDSAKVQAPGGCSPQPALGTDLTLQPCSDASTPLSASVWTWEEVAGEAGILSLASSPQLCAGQVGKNPDTGMPNLALTPCAPSDRKQHFLPFPLNGNSFLNPISGTCMDAEGGSSGQGARIELYGCDGGPNQKWVFANATGGVQLVVGNGGGTLCLAACNGK